jgi:hypothetical protein
LLFLIKREREKNIFLALLFFAISYFLSDGILILLVCGFGVGVACWAAS